MSRASTKRARKQRESEAASSDRGALKAQLPSGHGKDPGYHQRGVHEATKQQQGRVPHLLEPAPFQKSAEPARIRRRENVEKAGQAGEMDSPGGDPEAGQVKGKAN